MASYYVRSAAAGAGTGADWANAYTGIFAAVTGKVAGDIFYISADHNETTAGVVQIASPGSAAARCNFYCVDHTGSVPPVSADLRTTALIASSGANAVEIRQGHNYWYGVTFSAGSAANAANMSVGIATTGGGCSNVFKNCKLKLGNTSSSSQIFLGDLLQAVIFIELDNTPMEFGAVGQQILCREVFLRWRNTASAIAGSVPTTLFRATSTGWSVIDMEAIDLSAAGAGKTLIATGQPARYYFRDCKLGASVTVVATPLNPYGNETILVRCDSGDTNYRTEKYQYTGTQTVETTIVRTGGASDGATPIAWKIVTTANSKRSLPFESIPITIWNETVGSAITLTLEGIWGGGAVPTNADIWMDVEYLGTSGFPLGLFATSGTADLLATGSNLTSSSETWGGSTTKFKMSATVTPEEKGPITIYVKAALASSTFYIDPKVTVS